MTLANTVPLLYDQSFDAKSISTRTPQRPPIADWGRQRKRTPNHVPQICFIAGETYVLSEPLCCLVHVVCNVVFKTVVIW
jgi:hypothetical protein